MTLLFDIGRVLLDFDFEASLRRLLPEGVADGDERLARLIDRKDEFEAGLVSVDSYIEWALETLGSTAGRDQFRDAWQRIFTPNEPMWHRVRQLSGDGHRLILFSNTNAIHCPWIFETYSDFALFHGAVLSHEAGSIKPRQEIYQHAIDEHSLVPAETLYIDDLEANIATGRKLGFRCWQYRLDDHTAFEKWLASEIEVIVDSRLG